jgi:hypothetical protein
MTVTIELSYEEETRLVAEARREGIDPAELVRKLVVAHLPIVAQDGKPTDPTLALFAQWEQEDAQMTPEEIDAARQECEQFKQHINAERARAGARLIYP